MIPDAHISEIVPRDSRGNGFGKHHYGCHTAKIRHFYVPLVFLDIKDFRKNEKRPTKVAKAIKGHTVTISKSLHFFAFLGSLDVVYSLI